MDNLKVITALSALAQTTRLDAFRRLVACEPEGITVGVLAGLLGVPQNTLSAHLAILSQAGLIRGDRHSRSIVYRVRLDRVHEVILFILQDCCGGRLDLCAPLMAELVPHHAPMEPPVTDRPFNVLFLCTGNTARSILAEAILRQEGNGRFKAYSAGSQPKGMVNPFALKVLESLHYDTVGLRSKGWDEYAVAGAPEMDFVFTVCDNAAGETCPIWPGHPMTAHWGIEDPAAVEGSDIQKEAAFVAAARYLRNRITAFTNLPLTSLDKMALSTQMREIGRMDGATKANHK